MIGMGEPRLVMTQLFFVVFAMKEVIICSRRWLPQWGQVALVVSCSFRLNAIRDSFPQSKHL
jgi:hypothetical protein